MLHSPAVTIRTAASARREYLFAFIDDHSRAIVGHRFGFAEDTFRLAAVLRPALSSRGVPEPIYVDNGSAFVDTWLLRACASLAIRLTRSKPGRSQGRVKSNGSSAPSVTSSWSSSTTNVSARLGTSPS
ncbi:transposase family protein [Streptomyces sp. NPDC091371]|uniref:integrase catalytic domain-containing protein n=1 Tax=Streptomyces sp. NPDC091371 TaxID=3155303 RepID=UPI003445D9FF